MDVTAADWDKRVDHLSEKLPPGLRNALDWLREPSRQWLRIGAALLFIVGGVFSILPILGLWMLPLGLALLSQDIPWLKVPLEKAARWIERTWENLAARWRNRRS
jgi:hypothetical protein